MRPAACIAGPARVAVAPAFVAGTGAVNEFASGAAGRALVVGSVFDKGPPVLGIGARIDPIVRHAGVSPGVLSTVLTIAQRVPLAFRLAKKGSKSEWYVLRRLPTVISFVCL